MISHIPEKRPGYLKVILFILLSNFMLNGYAQSTAPKDIPDFTFFKLNGEPFSRKDLTKTKRVVIVFFDVTCDHCQHEVKAISDSFTAFKKAEFYLVSLDDSTSIQFFMDKYAPAMNGKPNVTLLRDQERQFIPNFLPVRYPAMYVYGTDWHLIKYFGPNSKVIDIIHTVND